MEAAAVDTNWSECWRRCRLSGLGSELTTFNFKLLHRLLVTNLRLFELGRRNSPACSLCAYESEDLAHTLLLCPYNQTIGVKLTSIVKKYLPGATNDMILRLEFDDLQEETEFSLTFVTSFILQYVWEKRVARCQPSLYEVRTSLEAKCILLRKTRRSNAVPILEEAAQNL